MRRKELQMTLQKKIFTDNGTMIGFWSDKKITDKELWNEVGPFEVCITWMKVFEVVLREMEIDRINSLFTFSIFLE